MPHARAGSDGTERALCSVPVSASNLFPCPHQQQQHYRQPPQPTPPPPPPPPRPAPLREGVVSGEHLHHQQLSQYHLPCTTTSMETTTTDITIIPNTATSTNIISPLHKRERGSESDSQRERGSESDSQRERGIESDSQRERERGSESDRQRARARER